MRDLDTLREAADDERKYAKEHGHWCEFHLDWFPVRHCMRRVYGRVICEKCYDGHAKCKPIQCIVHAPDSQRDPEDWRRVAPNLLG